ncbi:MAG TPA: hypothetical protein VJ046_01205 [Candidatus Paceibacterota bacterium]|nr:hypothetical protein [Candidatus Paceibacterota bacterium]
MNINRREFRRKLGTRTKRREGTKTKGIGHLSGGGHGKAGHPTRKQCYTNPRPFKMQPRPSVLLNALIRKAQAQQTEPAATA